MILTELYTLTTKKLDASIDIFLLWYLIGRNEIEIEM